MEVQNCGIRCDFFWMISPRFAMHSFKPYRLKKISSRLNMLLAKTFASTLSQINLFHPLVTYLYIYYIVILCLYPSNSYRLTDSYHLCLDANWVGRQGHRHLAWSGEAVEGLRLHGAKPKLVKSSSLHFADFSRTFSPKIFSRFLRSPLWTDFFPPKRFEHSDFALEMPMTSTKCEVPCLLNFFSKSHLMGSIWLPFQRSESESNNRRNATQRSLQKQWLVTSFS